MLLSLCSFGCVFFPLMGSSSQHFNNVFSECFNGDMNSQTPPLDHDKEFEGPNSEMTHQIFFPSFVHPQKRTERTSDEGVNNKNLSLNIRGEEHFMASTLGGNGFHKIFSKGHWSPRDDEKLKKLIAHYGPKRWTLISEHFEGRSGKSCRLRWFNQLDPKINKSSFSKEEETMILSTQKMYGNIWAKIARLFPGRTDNAVKNRWHVMNRRKREKFNNNCQRRKSSINESLSKGLNLTLPNNLGSELTILSPIDEFSSTSPNFSLTLSSTKSTPPFEMFFKSGQPSGDVMLNKYFGDSSGAYKPGPLGKRTIVVDQSNFSDTNSKASISVSIANNILNLSISEEKESESVGDKINMSFIDFLGVGDT